MPSQRILIIEDEPGLVRSLLDRFRAEGYEVEAALDGATGLERATYERWDAIVLDIMLPKMQGFDVCRNLRESGNQTPVIMLTARSHTADKVVGLKFGADDYLTKPFEMVELLARLEALIRRSHVLARPSGAAVLQTGGIRVDVRCASAQRDQIAVALSAREFRLLCYLMEYEDEVLSRERLLREVWGYKEAPVTRTVDVHIAQLRNKLEAEPAHPRYIHTVHGIGYRMCDMLTRR